MGNALPCRNPNRLHFYDYSRPGAYFITITTADRKNRFCRIVGATNGRPPKILLSDEGKIVDEAIQNIPIVYPAVALDRYVVMPNHVHLLLRIRADQYGRPTVAPTISTVIKQFKGYASKQIGRKIWQKSFHDHIIRDARDYENISAYIQNNPLYWHRDCFYAEQTP